MAFFDEVLSDLLRPTSFKDADQDARIAALEKDVEKLRRALGVLAQMLYENDAFGRLPRDHVRERFAKALRIEHDDGTPIPESDASTCASCGKTLFADDPELSLKNKGRVCMSCFQRGG